MSISQSLLPEFDHEMATTRKLLERLPADRLAWKPHSKSWSLRELATHIANLPTWTVATLQRDNFDLAPPGSPPPRAPHLESVTEIVDFFDANIGAARAAIAAASDADFAKPWSLLQGGKTVFTLPRVAVLRSFVLNHGIHHRGQLSVYLRLNEVPVPAIYGPSADESPR